MNQPYIPIAKRYAIIRRMSRAGFRLADMAEVLSISVGYVWELQHTLIESDHSSALLENLERAHKSIVPKL